MTLLGIDVPKVTAWLEANIAGAHGPFTFDLIAGGHSNITYKVTGADGTAYVLRRPPLGHLLASAHDMGREHRIIAALTDTPVPVAPALGLCSDAEVNDAPFYVMGFVDGLVVRTQEQALELLTPDARDAAGKSLVDVLAAIHAVDVDAVGLGTLAKKPDYIARQLKRWYGQWEQSKTRELPAVDEAYRTLSAKIPEQIGASLVHGDYRLDNCIVGPDGPIRAVLDWEICTLGDPLADAGLLFVYWGMANDGGDAALPTAPTTVEGFMSRESAIERYGQVSGRDLTSIDFYIAFAYWKVACIVEGVYARYLHGAMGQRDPESLSGFVDQVNGAAASAAEYAARL